MQFGHVLGFFSKQFNLHGLSCGSLSSGGAARKEYYKIEFLLGYYFLFCAESGIVIYSIYDRKVVSYCQQFAGNIFLLLVSQATIHFEQNLIDCGQSS